MRHAIRRILWVVPMMFAVSVMAFWVLAQGSATWPAHAAAPVGAAAAPEAERLPLFFNANPTNVRSLANEAVRGISEGGKRATEAQRLLVRLGGAALPHVLPHLDSLEPAVRARVAVSLAPVGRRMRVAADRELTDPQAAVLFWQRFWEDRAVDFNPVVVKRSVSRVARRATASRREDIMHLDTYALRELIDAMGPVRGPVDVPRARRIAELAAHVTGLDWRVSTDATPEQARQTVLHWQRWWRALGSQYLPFNGPRRLSAMVLETAYGKWALEVAQGELGVSLTGRPVLDLLRERSPTTLWLLASALLGGYLLGLVLGVWGALTPWGRTDAWTSLLATVLAALPTAVVAVLLRPTATAGTATAGVLTMVAVSAGLVSRFQRTGARWAFEQDYARLLCAQGASPARVATHTLRNSSSAMVSLLGAHLPTLLTAAFVVEKAFQLDGLADVTLRAVADGDVAWLMGLALCTVVATALVQLSSDGLLSTLDPQVEAVSAMRQEERP